jgi:chromosomal replication initiator protein
MKRHPSVSEILSAVAHFHGLTMEEIAGPRRIADLAHPRQMAYWIARELTPLSLPQIGRAIGGKDHTTVLHGCEVHAARMARSEDIRRDTDAIVSALLAIAEPVFQTRRRAAA